MSLSTLMIELAALTDRELGGLERVDARPGAVGDEPADEARSPFEPFTLRCAFRRKSDMAGG